MKQLDSIELISLFGGVAQQDCMWLLQYEANTHVSSGNKDMEKKYWANWEKRYDDCVGTLN